MIVNSHAMTGPRVPSKRDASCQAWMKLDDTTSSATSGRTDITFTLSKTNGPVAVSALEKVKAELGFEQVLYDDHVGKVSLVGAGMRSHPGVTASFCEALAKAGVNIEIINTSEIRISVLIRDLQVDEAVRAIHDAFGLGGDEEAVVYAGSGR